MSTLRPLRGKMLVTRCDPGKIGAVGRGGGAAVPCFCPRPGPARRGGGAGSSPLGAGNGWARGTSSRLFKLGTSTSLAPSIGGKSTLGSSASSAGGAAEGGGSAVVPGRAGPAAGTCATGASLRSNWASWSSESFIGDAGVGTGSSAGGSGGGSAEAASAAPGVTASAAAADSTRVGVRDAAAGIVAACGAVGSGRWAVGSAIGNPDRRRIKRPRGGS
jgi:hypothetical protein